MHYRNYNRMSAASILAPTHAAEPPSLLTIRIKALQDQHKQLEEKLRERVESLSIQINLAQKFVPFAQSGLSITLGDTITEQHIRLHECCSDRLLRRQVQMQQQAEMKEIIKNYEKRIMDLRSMLVGKEAEIVYDTFEIRRDNIPKRENLQIFNNQVAERVALRKSLEDLKRIRVQVGALEHAVKLKTAKIISNKIGLSPTDVSYISCTITEERPSERVDAIQLKKKVSSNQRDKLIAKVNQLLLDEMRKQDELKQALKQYKLEWQSVSRDHQLLGGKYKTLTTERAKAIRQVSTDNLLMDLQNQEQMEDNTKFYDLFTAKDQNAINSDTNRPSKRSNTLKDKRKQRSKEN